MNKKDLLQLLCANARLSNEELAQMLNTTEKKVENAIEKLVKDGVIQKFTAVINEEKISESISNIRALIEVSVLPEKNKGFDHIAQQVFKYDNVVDHYLVSGSYDFLIVVEGPTLQDISTFISSKLSSIKNIKGTRTHFILKKYKENYVVLDDGSSEHRLAISP